MGFSGERMLILRRRRGLSLAALAARMREMGDEKAGQFMLSRYERGASRPSSARAAMIARALGVEISELLTDAPARPAAAETPAVGAGGEADEEFLALIRRLAEIYGPPFREEVLRAALASLAGNGYGKQQLVSSVA